jgi:hypothetical protein
MRSKSNSVRVSVEVEEEKKNLKRRAAAGEASRRRTNERNTKHESEIGGKGRMFSGLCLISSLLVNWKKAVARIPLDTILFVIENVVAD